MTGEAAYTAWRAASGGTTLANGMARWSELAAPEQDAWEAGAAAAGAEGQEELVVALEAFNDESPSTDATTRLQAAGWVPPAAP